MRIAIVGNGPSILAHPEYGEMIDNHDKVIRLKRCAATLSLPLHFGSRTDIIAGSIGIAPELLDIGNKDTHIWVFTDSRPMAQEAIRSVTQFIFQQNRVVRCFSDLCNQLDARYRDMRIPFTPDAQTAPVVNLDAPIDENGQTLGHNHTSQGMKAICYALHLLRPDRITLFGFDNVKNGTFTFSLTRGLSHQRYPLHNWPTEKLLLEAIALDHPDTEIVFA